MRGQVNAGQQQLCQLFNEHRLDGRDCALYEHAAVRVTPRVDSDAVVSSIAVYSSLHTLYVWR